MTWRPIETAPRDGAVVLFHVPEKELPVISRCDDYWYSRKDDGTGFAYWLDGATHWQPLPPPPEAE